MERLVIYGSGGFGRELIRIAAESCARDGRTFVFANDEPEGPVLDIPVISPADFTPGDRGVIAIADSRARERLAERIKPAMLISPQAIIGPGVKIGPGAVICDFSIVTASATIGKHFQCNLYSYVAHDCVIGDFVTFAPKVCCNGNVRIGEHAYIGTGAVLKQGTPDKPLVIGKGAVVGMGAIVTKDVPDGATVIGNPARVR